MSNTIPAQTLAQTLKSTQPKRYYLLSGSESHLIEQSRKLISEYLIQQGVTEKTLVSFENPEQGLAQLKTQTDSLSLFPSKKQFICLLDSALKPNERKALGEWLSETAKHHDRNNHDYFIFQIEKVTTAQQKEAWYQFFLKHGLVVTHWPLNLLQYRQYLQQQAQARNISISPAGIQALSSLTEGHVLAGIQALDTISLYFPEHTEPLSEMDILTLIGQQSKYSLPDLYQAILDGAPERISDVLHHLFESKTPLPYLLWGLYQLVQGLTGCVLVQGQPVLPKSPAFQTQLRQKQTNFDPNQTAHLISTLHTLDKQVKSFPQAHTLGHPQAPQTYQAFESLCMATALIQSAKNYRNFAVS